MRRSLSLLEGLKKLQMRVFDQPAYTTRDRGASETKVHKKDKDIETTEEKKNLLRD